MVNRHINYFYVKDYIFNEAKNIFDISYETVNY